MRQRVALAALLAACSYGGASRADDTSDLQSLLNESVVTTASATAERASVAPGTSITITAEDLRTYGIRSLAEAVEFLSLGVTASDPLRTPDLGSRGVLVANDGGKHFLLLVNGHAINDPLYGAARFDQGAGVPMELIDHLEVIVGPGSVLYGSNAMMGVINVITKSASGYTGGHVMGEYEFGRSYRAGAGAGFTFKLFGAPSEITAGVEYYDRFGPDLDFAPQPFDTTAAFRRGGLKDGVWGGTAKDAFFTQAPSGILRFRSGDFELNVLASSYRRGIPYSTETTNVDFDDSESYERDHSLRVDLEHSAPLSSSVELSSRLYGDLFAYQRQVNSNASAACVRSDFQTCSYHDVGRAQWLGLEERLTFNWFHDGTFVTLLGADMREQWVQTKQDAIDFDTGAAFAPTTGRIDQRGSILSPYLQQTWSPFSWLDLNAGARLDKDRRFSPVVSPRGAVAVTPTKGMTAKASYSEAFRAPTFSETDLANYRVAPASGLSPEKVRSAEGSIEQRIGTQRVLMGVFRSSWSNLVALEPLSVAEETRLQQDGTLPIYVPPGIAQYRNVASVENYGWNASYEGSVGSGRFRYGVNATEAYTRRAEDGVSAPLKVAPELFGNARVAYSLGDRLPTFALAASYLSKRPADRALTVGAPIVDVPALAQFRLTITGAFPFIHGLSYRASAAVATASHGPYTAGPNLALLSNGATANKAPPLGFAPVDPFSAFVGLKYDFATGDSQ